MTLANLIAPLCCGLIWYATASIDGAAKVTDPAELVPGVVPVLTTVTLAVPTLAISAALICARSSVVLTNVVPRALPFHCTVDEELNPVPMTVSTNAGLPMATDTGDRGDSDNG